MACNDCALSKACRNSGIFGRGSKPKRTKYMFIQETPSRTDDAQNTPLTGEGQMKFSYLLDKAGINRKEVYYTYALKCKPRENSDIKKKHLEECRKYLFQEIITHKPDVIIPMGKWAFQAVSDFTSVREFRGHFTHKDFELDYEKEVNGKTIERSFKCKIIPTWSLHGSLYKWVYNPDMISDFKKAKKFVEEGVIDRSKEPKLNVILSKQGLKDFVEKYREVDYAATDFETTGFDFWRDKIINTGYCGKDGVADILYLEPYKREHTKKWDRRDVQRAKEINTFLKFNRNKTLEAIKTVNNFKHLKLILHNGKFDSKFAIANGIKYRNFWFDTLIADSLIDENLGHSLNVAMERRGINYGAYDTLLWPYINKDEKKKKSYQFVPPTLLEKYLGIDTWGDFQLFAKQLTELKKEGQFKHMFKRKMPALRDLVKNEYIGVKADKRLFKKSSRIIQRTQNKLLTKLADITGDEEFNPNSPKQINNHMIENGYPFKKLQIKENKSGYSTAAKELEKFTKYKKWKEFPQLIINSKKLAKIRGTYVDGKDGKGGMLQYLDKRHRIHANYNIWTPRTSRWSCNRPSLQVWPRPIKGLPNMRNAIVPTNKDWRLWEYDYSQIEQCVVASLSNDPVLTQRIQDGMDLHCINAADLGSQLQTIPKWVSYEHMLVANGKESLIKDTDVINEIRKDLETHGADINFVDQRTNAKAIGFGLNYGKTAITFAKDFKIDIDEAEEMVDAYFNIYSVMKSWRDGQVEKALTEGYVNLLSVRKRRFHHAIDWFNSSFSEGLWSTKMLKEEISRQAMNAPVQGGAHDIFEPAIIRLNRRFKKEGMKSRILLYIHDGILGESPLEERPYIDAIAMEEMKTFLNKGTPLEIELKVDGDHYDWEWYGKKIKI